MGKLGEDDELGEGSTIGWVRKIPEDVEIPKGHWLLNETRYYHLHEELPDEDQGRVGQVFRGYPCLADQMEIKNQGEREELIIKLPRIVRTYGDHEINERLDLIRQSCQRDFMHVRGRLNGCAFANTIIDMGEVYAGEFQLPVTVQPFLKDEIPLDRWLTPPRPDGERQRLSKDWGGICRRDHWAELCLLIARALEDVHIRRVVHADLHPGNIFISKKRFLGDTDPGASGDADLVALGESNDVKLIDFGESFVAAPGYQSRHRNQNAYLAPERMGPRFPLNEQVDVYSFGILMLYLATSHAHEFPPEQLTRDRRRSLEELFARAASARSADDLEAPCTFEDVRVVDVIGNCISRDPADRPRMTDVCNDLRDIVTARKSADEACAAPRPRGERPLVQVVVELLRPLGLLPALKAELNEPKSEGGLMPVKKEDPILTALLENEIRNIRGTFQDKPSVMIDVRGNRERMLRVLRFLFDSLNEGDSWTAATTLSMWQRTALGLNGGYAAANVAAVRRKVSVRRTFIVSVEELGLQFAEAFAKVLQASSTHGLRQLGGLFDAAIARLPHAAMSADSSDPSVGWHIDRLGAVLESQRRFVDWVGDVEWLRPKKPKPDVSCAPGLFIGICPVATLDEAGRLREQNPAALMRLRARGTERKDDQWLLVTTEARARRNRQRFGGGAARPDKAGGDEDFERPQLHGVRVYETVLKNQRPRDRINCFNKLMTPAVTTNVGPVITELVAAFKQADRATAPASEATGGSCSR